MASRSILFVAQPGSVAGVFPSIKDGGYEAVLAENLSGALAHIRKNAPLAVFTRPELPGYEAGELLAHAAEEEGFPPIYVFTDQGSAQQAQVMLAAGARDYWMEPLTWDKIRVALPRSVSAAPSPVKSAARPTGRPAASPAPAAQTGSSSAKSEIIANNPAVARVVALARRVAASRATVLISGESGTGKEMFARFLHNNSNRADQPFVAINCAALPEHLLESELFGHEKGSFTGAINRKLGKFELAHGGTILLDEISEMDLGLQAKLLRVLQESELDRVGGTETVKVDVRVLATTNRHLEDWVKQGKFRQDLYFRLNVIPLVLPPLRDRGDDVIMLARFFIERYCTEYGLPGLTVSDEAAAWMREYEWPGNVRELENLMERAVLLAADGEIRKEHFLLDPDALPDFTEPQPAPAVSLHSGTDTASGAGTVAAAATGDNGEGENGELVPLHEMERIMIMRGLKQTAGNRTQAAEILGISVRTLRNKLNEYRSRGHNIP